MGTRFGADGIALLVILGGCARGELADRRTSERLADLPDGTVAVVDASSVISGDSDANSHHSPRLDGSGLDTGSRRDQGASTVGQAHDVGPAGGERCASAGNVDAGGAMPSELVIPAAEDSSPRDGSPRSSTFAEDGELAVGYCSDAVNGNMRIWLKFDLCAVPAAARIVSAGVELYFTAHWGSQDYLVFASDVDTWDEQTLTWSNQPAFGDYVLDRVPAFFSDGVWKRWDVTSAVIEELAGDKTLTLVIEGATLFDPSTYPPDHENYARSREAANPSIRPRLAVTLD